MALFKTPGAFTKNQALRSKDGSEILLPMYYTPDGFFGHDSQFSSVQRSEDGGKTWTDSEQMKGTLGNLVQPTVVRLKSGRLMTFYRSRAADAVYQAYSVGRKAVNFSCSLFIFFPKKKKIEASY